MDIEIFYHGTHAWVLVHPRLVDSCKNHGTILWPGVHRKKVMATESPPGSPFCHFHNFSAHLLKTPLLFYSVQLRDPSLQSTSAHVTN